MGAKTGPGSREKPLPFGIAIAVHLAGAPNGGRLTKPVTDLAQKRAAFAANRRDPADSRMGFTGLRNRRQPNSGSDAQTSRPITGC
jgi:hypothetical protein